MGGFPQPLLGFHQFIRAAHRTRKTFYFKDRWFVVKGCNSGTAEGRVEDGGCRGQAGGAGLWGPSRIFSLLVRPSPAFAPFFLIIFIRYYWFYLSSPLPTYFPKPWLIFLFCFVRGIFLPHRIIYVTTLNNLYISYSIDFSIFFVSKVTLSLELFSWFLQCFWKHISLT